MLETNLQKSVIGNEKKREFNGIKTSDVELYEKMKSTVDVKSYKSRTIFYF